MASPVFETSKIGFICYLHLFLQCIIFLKNNNFPFPWSSVCFCGLLGYFACCVHEGVFFCERCNNQLTSMYTASKSILILVQLLSVFSSWILHQITKNLALYSTEFYMVMCTIMRCYHFTWHKNTSSSDWL